MGGPTDIKHHRSTRIQSAERYRLMTSSNIGFKVERAAVPASAVSLPVDLRTPPKRAVLRGVPAIAEGVAHQADPMDRVVRWPDELTRPWRFARIPPQLPQTGRWLPRRFSHPLSAGGSIDLQLPRVI